jgi:hypothetical protein
MRTADMVKSKFFGARDLKGQPPLRLTIAHVTEELMGRGSRQDVKCFLWFTDHPKGLQLNKTRVTILEAAFGPDSELWTGKRVRLSFDPTVMFGTQAVGGVRLETPPGVTYTPSAELHAGWGEAPAAVSGRLPAPVWDEQRGVWVTPPPIAAPKSSGRPPAPVWNEATGQWETVNPGTGEIASQGRPKTISERVNQGHPAQVDTDWGTAASTVAGAAEADFNDDIPF